MLSQPFNTRMLKGAILTPFDVHFAVILLLSSVSVVPFKNLLILLFWSFYNANLIIQKIRNYRKKNFTLNDQGSYFDSYPVWTC